MAQYKGSGGDEVVVGTTDIAGSAVFSNSNNVSFGVSAGTITASASFAQTNQQATFFAVGNTTQATSATNNASSIVLRGAGIASVGVSAGSLVVSVPSEAQTFLGGVSVNGVGAITAGSIVLSNSPTVTFGLAGSTVTASAAGGGAAAADMSVWVNQPSGGNPLAISSNTRAIFWPLNYVQPMAGAMSWDTMALVMGAATNVTTVDSHTIGISIGLYKLSNATQLSLINSATWSTGLAASASSYINLYAGTRLLSIASSQWSSRPTVSAGGSYWMAIAVSTAGSVHANCNLMGQNFIGAGTIFSGAVGASGTSGVPLPWYGMYSASTNAMPTAVSRGEVVPMATNQGNGLIPTVVAAAGVSWM